MAHPTVTEAMAIVFDVWRALQAIRLGMTADDDELKSCFGVLAGLLSDKLGDAYCVLLPALQDGAPAEEDTDSDA